MINVLDEVEVVQLDLFDNSLFGERGIVLSINNGRSFSALEKPTQVNFRNMGVKTLPIGSLAKVKKP
jgi:hypothetical protein